MEIIALLSTSQFRALLLSLTLCFVSLFLPWWTFLLYSGELVASFNLFLWGDLSSGFLSASSPFGWWYVALLGTLIAALCLGITGYVLSRRNEGRARIVMVSYTAFLVSIVCVYPIVLLAAFRAMFSGLQSFWQVSSPRIMVASLYIFNYVYSENLAAVEFLNAGYFLTLASSILSAYVTYKVLRSSN